VTTEFTTLKGGTETILLAEDEISIRKFKKNVLEKFGYKVIDAFDGEDAIDKFRYNKDKIQLLILDVGMPKKTGIDAYKEIKNIRPDIKVIFISGYDPDILHKKGVFKEGLNFIAKPTLPTEILRKVREVLDK
jgi:DNA-binding response OmpR family regulator